MLADARNGGTAAFASLYRAFQPLVLRYLRARDATAAEDSASDTWLGVARGLAQFEGNEVQFRAWLFAIARNRLADAHRRSGRQPHVPLADDDDQAVLADGTSVPDLVIDRFSGQEAVELLRANLLPDQLEVILLRVLAGLDVPAVAGLLDRPQGWVRVTQHRAVQRLASRLGPRWATSDQAPDRSGELGETK